MSASPPARPAVHFRGLNELRCLAAFAVILHHVERNKAQLGYPSLFDVGVLFHFVTHLGQLGVSSFFVLSGFLMTFLLLSEHRLTGGIDVRAFYARRILRIWPLYFVTVAIGFVLIPWLARIVDFPQPYMQLVIPLDRHYWSVLTLFVCMLPNVAIRFYPAVLGASHAWSIGLEEQFYAVWPWFLRRFVHRLVPALLGLIAIKFLVEDVLLGVTQWGAPALRKAVIPWHLFVRALWIENMAIGALGALLLLQPSRLTRIVLTGSAQAVALGVIALLAYGASPWPRLDHLAEPVAFLVLMLNLSVNDQAPWRIDSPLLSRLGQISYGLYMFHPAVLETTLALLPRISGVLGDGMRFNAVLYGVVVTVTVLLSQLSYRYVESPFIRWKGRFAVVRTQPEGGTPEVAG